MLHLSYGSVTLFSSHVKQSYPIPEKVEKVAKIYIFAFAVPRDVLEVYPNDRVLSDITAMSFLLVRTNHSLVQSKET